MLNFELVSKKRKPVKRYAVAGVITGIVLFFQIGFSGYPENQSIKVALMVVTAITFVVCLFIINYSASFKNTIGRISFSEDYIEIVINKRKEIFRTGNIRNIRFKLTGYEGLNNSTFFEYLVWSPAFFSYHNGMNNFVSIVTANGNKRFEFYIPNKRSFLEIKKLAMQLTKGLRD